MQQMALLSIIFHVAGCVRKCDFLFFAGYGLFHLGKPLEISIDNTKVQPFQAGIFLGSPMDCAAQGVLIFTDDLYWFVAELNKRHLSYGGSGRCESLGFFAMFLASYQLLKLQDLWH